MFIDFIDFDQPDLVIQATLLLLVIVTIGIRFL